METTVTRFISHLSKGKSFVSKVLTPLQRTNYLQTMDKLDFLKGREITETYSCFSRILKPFGWFHRINYFGAEHVMSPWLMILVQDIGKVRHVINWKVRGIMILKLIDEVLSKLANKQRYWRGDFILVKCIDFVYKAMRKLVWLATASDVFI